MKIRKLVIAIFAMAPLFFSLTGCSRPVALVEPSFQVPNGSSATVQEVIRQALLGRRWAIQEKLPDGYIAQYDRRPDVWARIKVTHLGRQVTIRYVDSEGLKYKKNRFGSVSVSRWYRTWVLNLESDIKFQIGKTVVS